MFSVIGYGSHIFYIFQDYFHFMYSIFFSVNVLKLVRQCRHILWFRKYVHDVKATTPKQDVEFAGEFISAAIKNALRPLQTLYE